MRIAILVGLATVAPWVFLAWVSFGSLRIRKNREKKDYWVLSLDSTGKWFAAEQPQKGEGK